MPVYEGTGAEQMAIDNWLLDQHVKGLQPPMLRFYTWRSPTISLGYHQRQFPEPWKMLRWQDQPIELVRRPTGGRAVLHQGDLTYALILSGLKGSRREIYRQLCQFLIEGFSSLGVSLSFGEAGRGYIHNPNCFGTATAADLVMDDGYKLIGSAQVYREGCVLQHGSIRLQPDTDLFEKVFGEVLSPPLLPAALFGSEVGPEVGPEAMTSGIRCIADSLLKAAGASFEQRFTQQPLTSLEVQDALSTHQIALERGSK